MKRFNKIYLEISNICNLECAFCPGTRRPPRVMSEEELEYILSKIEGYTDYLYFHLMGEPLCHPRLESFIEKVGQHGFRVILTTNGTLLSKHRQMLLDAKSLHKVNISLHSFEANDLKMPFDTYLDGCFEFGRAAEGEKIVVYRLWNSGGADGRNGEILDALEKYFPKPWAEERKGIRIGERIYVENGEKFEWPDMSADKGSSRMFCMGMRDQLGILADGSVVPCCLDHEGDITLGNIFKTPLEQITTSDRATAILKGFENGIASEELCLRCGYAHAKFN